MEFSFKAEVVLSLEANKGDKSSKLISTDFYLEVSRNLKQSNYLDEEGMPTKDGCKVLTECLTQGLAANIHYAHQLGLRDSAEHLRYIIAQLEKAFIAQGEISKGHFNF